MRKVICIDDRNSDLIAGGEYEVYAEETRGGIEICWLTGWPYPYKKNRFIDSDKDPVKVVTQILSK